MDEEEEDDEFDHAKSDLSNFSAAVAVEATEEALTSRVATSESNSDEVAEAASAGDPRVQPSRIVVDESLMGTRQSTCSAIASRNSKDSGESRGADNDLLCNIKLPFPWKLYKLLEYVEPVMIHIVSWMPDGYSFRVHDREAFVTHVMPRFFRMSKYQSFTRQLYIYGFSKIDGGRNHGAFYHKDFVRGMKDRCLTIGRNQSEDRRLKSAVSERKRQPAQEQHHYAGDSSPAASRVASRPIREADTPNSHFVPGPNCAITRESSSRLRRLDSSSSSYTSSTAHLSSKPMTEAENPLPIEHCPFDEDWFMNINLALDPMEVTRSTDAASPAASNYALSAFSHPAPYSGNMQSSRVDSHDRPDTTCRSRDEDPNNWNAVTFMQPFTNDQMTRSMNPELFEPASLPPIGLLKPSGSPTSNDKSSPESSHEQ